MCVCACVCVCVCVCVLVHLCVCVVCVCLCIIICVCFMFVSVCEQGLIKIRGDKCWRDLTCMNYHYEVTLESCSDSLMSVCYVGGCWCWVLGVSGHPCMSCELSATSVSHRPRL